MVPVARVGSDRFVICVQCSAPACRPGWKWAQEIRLTPDSSELPCSGNSPRRLPTDFCLRQSGDHWNSDAERSVYAENHSAVDGDYWAFVDMYLSCLRFLRNQMEIQGR